MKNLSYLFLAASAFTLNAQLSLANESCEGPTPIGVDVRYDEAGRLQKITDSRSHRKLEFFYDRYYTTVSETERLKKASYTAYSETPEQWGPSRMTVYQAHDGRLTRIHTYDIPLDPAAGKHDPYESSDYEELSEAYGRKALPTDNRFQTTFEIPAAAPGRYHRDSMNHLIYTGIATQENVEYEILSRKERSIDVREPLNLKKAECYSFAGNSFPLQEQVWGFKQTRTITITGNRDFFPQATGRRSKTLSGGGDSEWVGSADYSPSSYSGMAY
ncbi:hypothetical protein WDW37_18365 [Bdellovibrionota bacterium FG-1]